MKVTPASNFPLARKITYKELVSHAKMLGFVDSLMSLQRLASLMSNQAWVNINIKFDFKVASPIEGSMLLSRDFISFFSKQIVLFASGSGGYNDTDLVKFVYDYNNMETDLDSLDPKHPDSWIWVLRATNHQWFYIRLPEAIVGRYYYLFSKVFSDVGFREKIRIVLGIDVFDLAKIGFCIMANYAVQKDGKHADSFLMSSYTNTTIEELRPLLSETNILNFMSHFAIDRKGFKKRSRQYALEDQRLKKYEFNALRRFPVIKTREEEGNKQYIIPSLQDFIYAFSEGLYYLLLDSLIDASVKQELFQKLGSAFEDYVGDMLSFYEIPTKTKSTFQRELIYPTSQGEVKTADWLLISDEFICQVECKKRKPDNYARAGVEGSDGGGLDDLLTDIANQLDKLVMKQEHIEKGLVPSIAYGGKKFINVLVYLDEMFSVGNYGLHSIKEKMKKEIPEHTYVVGSYEFELMCQHFKNTGKPLHDCIDDVRTNNLEKIFHIDFLSEEYKKFTSSLGVKGREQNETSSTKTA